MARFTVLFSLFLFVAFPLFSQTAVPPSLTASTSDAQAIAIATQSLSAMTGRAMVNDATLNGNVIWVVGSDNKSGTGTLYAKGTTESRVDLSLNSEIRTEVRTSPEGIPSGQWKIGSSAIQTFAQHNCWTDAVWFFPVLSSLTQTGNPNFVFLYLGQEQRDGLSVLHIRISQALAGDTATLNLSRLSTTDIYFDPVSFLPLAIGFKAHPDSDLKTDIPIEIQFADYRVVNGVQIPFHIQQMLNGGVILDFSVTNAVLNSGLPDSDFILQ